MEGSKRTQVDHMIHVENRKKMELSGVNNVITFNENLIILQTTLGILNIKGSNMKVNKLNVDNGDMLIEGEFVSYIYSTKNEGKKGSILEKLLK